MIHKYGSPEPSTPSSARTKLLGVERLAVHLDQTRVGGQVPQQPQPVALGLARRIGLVPQIGILGLRVDRVVGGRGPEQAECLLTDPLGQMIEVIAHAPPKRDTSARGARGQEITTHDLIPRSAIRKTHFTEISRPICKASVPDQRLTLRMELSELSRTMEQLVQRIIPRCLRRLLLA
jgi:hypothetical protein